MEEPLLISDNPVTTPQEGFAIGAIAGTVLTLFLVFCVLQIIANWKIFKKAGEKGWKSLIPIYNSYISFKILGLEDWFWYILFVSIITSIIMTVQGFNPSGMTDEQIMAYDFGAHPFVIVSLAVLCVFQLVASILVARNCARVFSKNKVFAVCLFFFPSIFWLIIGFDGSKYNKKKVIAK